jgi:DNA polymerase-1
MSIEFNYIDDETKLTRILKKLMLIGYNYYIGFDTETSGIDERVDSLRLAQFSIDDDIYILNMEKLDMKYLKYVLELLIEKDTIFIIHNSKFDIKFIYHNTRILIEKVFDTMVAESIITGCSNNYAGLDYLLDKYLSIKINKEIRKKFLDSDITNEMILYSAIDVKHLFDLMNKQMVEITKLKLVETLDLEMRVVTPTAKMEYDGIYLDGDMWVGLSELSEKGIVETEKEIKDSIWNRVKIPYENAYDFSQKFGIKITTKRDRHILEKVTDIDYIKEWWYNNFNINSRIHVMSALNHLGISLPNFQKKTLESFKSKDKIINSILENKVWAKRISTYGADYLKYIHPITGRIHSEFNQNGTKSGRYSSSSPNLQQVPIATIKEKCLWRECFLPGEEHIFLASDYSQQEYRTVGQITGEDKIINAYLNNLDLHANTASIIYDVNIDDVTSEQRYVGKTINFGLLYGMTKWGLARNLNISVKSADVLMSKVLSGLPKFSHFKYTAEKLILKNMYSRTMLGRIRFFERQIIFEDNMEYDKYIARIKREGFNHIIQGTAADMLKLAFAYTFERNPFGELFKVVLLIHDEILAEVHESIQYEAKEFLEKCMSDAFYYFVPDIPTKIDARLIKAWSK